MAHFTARLSVTCVLTTALVCGCSRGEPVRALPTPTPTVDRAPPAGITWKAIDEWDSRILDEERAIREAEAALTDLQRDGSPQLDSVKERKARWRRDSLAPFKKAIFGTVLPEEETSVGEQVRELMDDVSGKGQPGDARELSLYGAGRVDEVTPCLRESNVQSKYGGNECIAVVLIPTMLDPKDGLEAPDEYGKYWLYYPAEMRAALTRLSAGKQIVFRDCEVTSKSGSWIACDMADYDEKTGATSPWWLGEIGLAAGDSGTARTRR